MKQSLPLILIGGTALACFVVADLASAQPIPPQPPASPIAAPPPASPGASARDVQQLSETRGAVACFTLTPRGELDGFLLTDGNEVHLPPHLSDQLATAVRPGDTVSVRGYRSSTAPPIVAMAVTDNSTSQTVVDQRPPPPGVRPPPLPPGVPSPGAQQTSFNGRVQTSLYALPAISTERCSTTFEKARQRCQVQVPLSASSGKIPWSQSYRTIGSKSSRPILIGRALRADVLRLTKDEGWRPARPRLGWSFESLRTRAQARAPPHEAGG